MIDLTQYKFCPSCGKPALKLHQKNAMMCVACGYVYFHNTASAVAGIIHGPDGIVLVKRNHAPKKGYFDLPGGFVDYNESAETALRREIVEELAVPLKKIKYFGSFPNIYRFCGVRYYTCDIVFTCTVQSGDLIQPNDEISEIKFVRPAEIDFDRIAFKSIRFALKKYARNV
jgi:NADH pyrophosphatase NudC (nudix superfamily)